MNTIEKYFRVDRRQIAFLRFIFEAYDGIAMVTTVNPEKGLVVLLIPPGCEPEAEMLVQDMRREMMIIPAGPDGEELSY